jgi:RHS repeat-associated protein
MELGYNETLGLPGTVKEQFNGNISTIKWNAMPGLNTTDVPQKGYAFHYDPLSRLEKAEYKEKTTLWTSSNAFNESNITYDKNGNILSLQRKEAGQDVDQLTYSYGTGAAISNRLLSVTDASSDTKGFKETNAIGDDYVYDANGNLLWDRNKGGKEMLKNSDFSEGGAHWVINGSNIVIESGSVTKTNQSASGRIDQYGEIIPSRPYIVIVDADINATGAFSIGVGGTSTPLQPGLNVFTVTASTGENVRVTFTESFVGKVNKVDVRSITVIEYNYLNLPQKVTLGRESLVYIYDGTGRKLGQWLYSESSVAQKQTDYAGEFFYENDTLKFINHEEGRVVMTGAEPEYQYHLKDHLGNVRVTFTTKDEIEEFPANGELSNQLAESNRFDNYSPTEKELFNHTEGETTYRYAQLLHGGHNSQVAWTKSLSVMPGDTIKAEVYAKYQELVNPGSGLAGFAAALTSAFGFDSPVPGDPGTAYDALDSYGTLIEDGLDHSEDEIAPKAYLNILLFDREHNFVDATYKQIGIDDEQGEDLSVKDDHGHLTIEKLVTTPGYAYIFLSNENPVQVDVFFDDLNVEHVKSPVVQMDNYYPFGLTFNSYSRENATPQNYLYNGKEIQDELDLRWYDYQARQYDASIGRFLSIDPAADLMRRFSTYAYAFDNPIRFIDPDGMIPDDVTDPNDPKKKETKPVQQKVDELYANDQPISRTPNEGGDGGLSGSVSIGLQGGLSVKLLGENLSLYANFGSIDILTFGNHGVEIDQSPNVDIKEGVDLGLGPVGLSKEIVTSRGSENGEFSVKTTEKTTVNVFNVEGSSNTYKEVRNPESTNPQKTEMSNTSVGASQSVKGGAFIGVNVSVGASYTFGTNHYGVKELNPKYVASDATRVAPRITQLKRR